LLSLPDAGSGVESSDWLLGIMDHVRRDWVTTAQGGKSIQKISMAGSGFISWLTGCDAFTGDVTALFFFAGAADSARMRGIAGLVNEFDACR
jgi:hypothetical protein